MLDNHYIEWVAIETNKGFALKHLKPGEEPMSEFALADDKGLVAVYAYCNLHSLWKKWSVNLSEMKFIIDNNRAAAKR